MTQETNFQSQEVEKSPMIKKSSKNRKLNRWLNKVCQWNLGFIAWKIILVLIIIGGLIYLLCPNLIGLGLSNNSQKWQAVFLVSGQVYFGKIVKETNRILVLKDVHYLNLQTETPRPSKEGEQTTQQPGLSVVKLGQEVHQPENMMRINKDHVLLVESLSSDSQIVKVIEEMVKQK